MKKRKPWSLPRSIRRLFRLADSSYIGDAIADMLDRDHNIDAPTMYDLYLRRARADLRRAAALNRIKAKATN